MQWSSINVNPAHPMKKIVTCREFWIPIIIALIIVALALITKYWDPNTMVDIGISFGIATPITFALMGAVKVSQRYDLGRPLREWGFPHPDEFRKGTPTVRHTSTYKRISYR
jgi:hypothetical protein